MGVSPTPIDLRPCAYCGQPMPRRRYPKGTLEPPCLYARRKYCDLACSGMGQRKTNPTPGAIGKRVKPLRAAACERCGATSNLSIHHVDENRLNNDPSNLQTLCSRCHTTVHWETGKTMPVKSPPCRVCGQRSKGHGLCGKHYQRWRKWGDPLMVKVNQYSGPVRVTE